jgi:glycosyltransferase involved in cell wall biosynthesis
MVNSRPSISVFFPCYNDSHSIEKLVKNAFTILKSISDDYEVIVIDDGSQDASREILLNLAKKYPLKLIFHEKNLGYGGALKSGFKAASKDLIFYTDGDGQYQLDELPLLIDCMTPDVDFVNGIKIARVDPTYRIFIGNLYSFIVRWLFWLPIEDIDCDFRLIRSEVVKKLDLKSISGSICIELVKKSQRAGAKFRQVSIHHYERRFGKSQFFRPKHLLSTAKEVISLWFCLMIRDKIFKGTLKTN